QDGKQRNSSPQKCLFTKYDVLNRPIQTGLMDYSEALKTTIETNSNPDDRFEIRNTSFEGYTSAQSNPPTDANTYFLTVTFYDDYSWIELDSTYLYDNQDLTKYDYSTPANENSEVKGLVTGSMVRDLEATNDWITTVIYYDNKYRTIQTVSDNALGYIDRVSTLYDFVGQPLIVQSVHTNDDGPAVIQKEYIYDHAGRLTETYMDVTLSNVSTSQRTLLAANTYNELGQLIDKNLHSIDQGESFDQYLDYQYNIRGWLTDINTPDLTAQDGDNQADLFGMHLAYNKALAGASNTVRFNGNISAMKWSSFSETGSTPMTYSFGYDKLNRLEYANVSGNGDKAYSVPAITYDLNGNIETLQRRGTTDGSFMDDLTYTYKNGKSNQLLSVEESPNGTPEGFDNGITGSADDYDYDANGNMTKDLNKRIDSIYYNHLNLPEKVDFGGGDSLLYHYDAAGIKLRQKVFEAGSSDPSMVRTYAGEFYYENENYATDPDGNVLKFVQNEEGRIVPKNIGFLDFKYDYQYHLKDHLGNTRMTFSRAESTVVATMENQVQEGGYFAPYTPTPNGLSIPGSGNTSPQTMRLNTNEADDGGAILNGAVGLKNMIVVETGDELELSVQAYYPYTAQSNVNMGTTLLLNALLANGAGGSSGGEGTPLNASNVDESLITSLQNNQSGFIDDNVPRGFLNYIHFNSDMSFNTSGFVQISSTAGTQWETIEFPNPVVIGSDGYVLIYVSNETNAA
ncbi:MAG: hypothetical protein GY820_28425, partial [Gammaproteobacteria bacterium]|nr:hypothetical protein [Gammaproteobacteria bacterium]